MGTASIPQSFFAPWTRKHDKPGIPVIPAAPVTFFPRSLQDLITICRDRPAGMRLHAAGSHWALSTAAISDHSFIETHDPHEVFPVMGRTLRNVVPGCMSDQFLKQLDQRSKQVGHADSYFVHFESGKRIYQLYSELDVGDSGIPDSLCTLMQTRFNNQHFTGSWGFHTLGGAGGQTVVGALSTGTHGGDFDRPPLADAVVALHVVTDGGRHIWIERFNSDLHNATKFTDEAKLRALFAPFPGFDVLYEEDVWRAAIIQVGRFGAVYSAVLQVVPQYGLRQALTLDTWENVRDKITSRDPSLFVSPFTNASNQTVPQHFLQIAINPIPGADGTVHQCGITKRWTVGLSELPLSVLPPVTWSSAGGVVGRPERVGNIVVPLDPILNAPRFSEAGVSIGFTPDETGVTSFDLMDSACQDANFMDGIVSGIYTEIENFLSTNAVAIGGGLAAATAAGLGPGILALAPWLLALLAILAAFLDWLRNQGGTRGQALNNLRNALLGSSDPNQRLAGILVWRAIAQEVFKQVQKPQTYSAISYAVMDGHNYTDISCDVNVRSVEVFFDATDPRLIQFVDQLLQFEINQEFQAGKSVVGYISLRFCQKSEATIGPEQSAQTVAGECSGLADDTGSTKFVNAAVQLALDQNIKGILHWGQQNDSTQEQIEFRFGDSTAAPGGQLGLWRGVLSRLTENGRLDGFSSEFTRRTGLEVVQPVMGSFLVTAAPTVGNPNCTVAWDCRNNPAATAVTLEIFPPAGPATQAPGLALTGSQMFSANQAAVYVVRLQLSLTLNGETRIATQDLNVNGV